MEGVLCKQHGSVNICSFNYTSTKARLLYGCRSSFFILQHLSTQRVTHLDAGNWWHVWIRVTNGWQHVIFFRIRFSPPACGVLHSISLLAPESLTGEARRLSFTRCPPAIGTIVIADQEPKPMWCKCIYFLSNKPALLHPFLMGLIFYGISVAILLYPGLMMTAVEKKIAYLMAL